MSEPTSSPTPSLSIDNSPTCSPTPTFTFNATSDESSSSSSSTLAPGSVAAIVIFVFIFIGISVILLWRRRLLASTETTTNQFSSPRYGGGSAIAGSQARHGLGNAGTPHLDSGNGLFQWFTVATARLCPNTLSAPPRRQGPGGSSAIGTTTASASQQSGGASRTNQQQQSGANAFGLRQTQAQQLTTAQRFTASVRTLFSGARLATAPPRELRANALPINLNSRNFQVSNPLARKT